MAISPSLRIEKLSRALKDAEIGVNPVEVHGSLVGLICGGVTDIEKQWLGALVDLINDGQELPKPLQKLVDKLYQDTLKRITDSDFGFTPMLPEEEESVSTRVEALSLWVQSFLAGIAIVQPKLNRASADVQEVIADLVEIARVEFDVADDEESETALMELTEFAKMAALLCFVEFGHEDEHDKNEKVH